MEFKIKIFMIIITITKVRMEKVKFASREGATSEGCPIAKWVREITR